MGNPSTHPPKPMFQLSGIRGNVATLGPVRLVDSGPSQGDTRASGLKGLGFRGLGFRVRGLGVRV